LERFWVVIESIPNKSIPMPSPEFEPSEVLANPEVGQADKPLTGPAPEPEAAISANPGAESVNEALKSFSSAPVAEPLAKSEAEPIVDPFTPGQLAWIERMLDEKIKEKMGSMTLSPIQHQHVKEMLARKEFALFAGSSHPELAKKIADELHAQLGEIDLIHFDCGEQTVKLLESVRGKIVFMIQTCRKQLVYNDLDQLYKMSDAAINGDSGRRIAVVPYLGDMREDKSTDRGPISTRVVANNLEANGYTCMITTLLHAPQIQADYKIPVYNVIPYKLFADSIRNQLEGIDPKRIMVVATDAGGEKGAKVFAKELNMGIEKNVAIIIKERYAKNKSRIVGLLGDVSDKICFIIDDILDSGGSVCNAAEYVRGKGASEVHLIVTHFVASGKAIENLEAAKFKSIMTTDTLPLDKEKTIKGLVRLSVARLFADLMGKIAGIRSDKAPQKKQNNFTDGAGI
jgi:ribose-phosphate pyrophosphokinase